jgi:uncharacterized protein YjbJ (UPF0337 family)
MNKEQFSGKWQEFKGFVKEKWGKLTDDDLTTIDGKWDQLAGKLQQRYGWAKAQADRELSSWWTSMEEKTSNSQEHWRAEGEKKHAPHRPHHPKHTKTKRRKAG